jgi:uncharacterized protein YbjT (DUF2867 family)
VSEERYRYASWSAITDGRDTQGITGNQGGSVAKVFRTLPEWHVRGVTRDPNKSSAKAWSDAGVEIVAGNLNDEASLVRAFEGAYAIFGVTDFVNISSALGGSTRD